jgi:hypothetical protein
LGVKRYPHQQRERYAEDCGAVPQWRRASGEILEFHSVPFGHAAHLQDVYNQVIYPTSQPISIGHYRVEIMRPIYLTPKFILSDQIILIGFRFLLSFG